MGYSPGMARRSAWQFLQKTNDPRISMLRKFALGIAVASLSATALLPTAASAHGLGWGWGWGFGYPGYVGQTYIVVNS